MFFVASTLVLASAQSGALAVQLLVMLATAALVATLLRKLNMELIPGYLLAGVLVGPHALGLVHDREAVDAISGLAVILLMFGIGMHLDVNSMKRGLVPILAVGGITTLVTIAGGWALVLPYASAPAALVIAMAVSMSSTAVLVRVLMARRESRAMHGRVALGIAIVQDLASVVIMALLPPIAKWAGASFPGAAGATSGAGLPKWVEFLSAGGIGLGGVTVMLLAGRVLLPRVLGLVARVGSSELVLVVSAVIALGAAIGTAKLGFSAEMGAFLAGFLLASTPFRYQLAGQLAPMRDLLMAVFFTAVGMRVDPAHVGSHLALVVGGGLLVVFGKWAVISAGGWFAGMSAPSATLAGAYLSNAGEFSLVVLAAAGGAGILTGAEQGTAIAATIVSLIVSPILVDPAHRLAAKLSRVRPSKWAAKSALGERDAPPAPTPDPAGAAPSLRHVVIAGFGPVGRTLADRFAVLGVGCTVIELNPRTVQRQTTLGKRVVYGDVTNPEVLEEAGVARADAVFLTIPDDETVLRATKAIRQIAPDVFIAARTSFLSGKFVAHQLGADLVTVEEVATAQAMEREVLAHMHRVLRPAERAGTHDHDHAPDATP